MGEIDTFFWGRQILLIAPRFFGYETKIVEHLQGLGAEVQFLDERPGNSFFIKALIRIRSPLARPIIRRYYRTALDVLKKKCFDDILIISPECCDEAVLCNIRRTQPKARVILYMWDALAHKGWKGIRAITFVSKFDRALSFDDVDAAKFGMILRPLFYSTTVGQPDPDGLTYTFSFIGTIHSDRFRVLKSLSHCAQTRNLKTFVHPYLPSRILYWLFRLTKPEFRGISLETFAYSPMPYEKVLDVFRASQCIVDIEHPGQRGLTMRTLEVIGSGKHLITTNPNIKCYPFFRPDRVTVIDRHDVMLPDPIPVPSPLDNEEKHALSLSGWCEDVFDFEV